MSIFPASSSIQTLKAQQAWEARKASRATMPTATPNVAAAAAPTIEVPRPAAPVENPAVQHWGQTVQEVQNIAQRAGFMGVTEQDIRRAYTYGESLLADYRV